jgi:hypothetical protein
MDGDPAEVLSSVFDLTGMETDPVGAKNLIRVT